jgi:hypothetical protein
MLAAIDLHGCRRARLADPDLRRSLAPAVIEAIGTPASVTVHADEVGRRCSVDVVSCRPFAAHVAAAVAFEHFGGVPTLRVVER